MLKFKKSECNCMICGNKNMEGGNEEMNIIRDRGDNLIAFSVCRKCRIRMVYELDSHNREWDKNQRFPGKPEKGKEDGDKSF